MIEQTHSELHTHFIGMLSFKGILTLLKRYKYSGFPINNGLELDFKDPIDRSTVINPYIKNALCIEQGNTVSYRKLDDLYNNRRQLLNDVAKDFMKRNGLDPKNEPAIRRKVYSDFLNLSLIELINQGVDYVEISYFNASFIKYMLANIPEKIKEKISVKFIVCTGRDKSSEDIKQYLEDVKKAFKSGDAIGFDFMGIESKFEAKDLYPYPDDTGFEYKLDMVIERLLDYPNSSLRIHAGENMDSKSNPLNTLRMIDRISKRRGITIPPPEIRLGHAIYFDKCDEYLNLLKKFKCIVEVNASSNMALSNIKEYDQIDYKYYLDNGIDLVVSTDGGGLYSTDIINEDYIANASLNDDDYQKIIDIDKKVVKRKVGN